MRPMLAGPFVPEHVRYPVIVQPKLDGIRAVVGEDGLLYSRNERPIRNQFIQSWVRELGFCFQGLDGELMVGDPTAEDAYRVTDSGVMSAGGQPDFTYMVFDYMDLHLSYNDRRDYAADTILDVPRTQLVDQEIAVCEEELLAIEARFIAQGYEGVILRDPQGTYKAGRSTSREGKLLKLKRFEDSDAIVLGMEELYSNQNPKTVGAHGLTERTSHAANMVSMNTLGALRVRDVHSGLEFRIGSFKGLNLEQRRDMWLRPSDVIGRQLVYKYQKVGGYDLPRFPIFKGWRSDL